MLSLESSISYPKIWSCRGLGHLWHNFESKQVVCNLFWIKKTYRLASFVCPRNEIQVGDVIGPASKCFIVSTKASQILIENHQNESLWVMQLWWSMTHTSQSNNIPRPPGRSSTSKIEATTQPILLSFSYCSNSFYIQNNMHSFPELYWVYYKAPCRCRRNVVRTLNYVGNKCSGYSVASLLVHSLERKPQLMML